MTIRNSVHRTLAPVVLSSLFLSTPLMAQVTANDDGSVGVPFATTDEDTLLDTSGGVSVTTNDTGAFSVLAFDAFSSKGAAVAVSGDGTFTYNPTILGDAQELSVGASFEDTFTYTIVETPTFATGVTFDLDASSASDSFPWLNLPTIVAATGTSLPAGIVSAHGFAGSAGANRTDFSTGPDYSLGAASFEFWLKADAVNVNQTIFESGGSGVGCSLVINDDGTVSWLVKSTPNLIAQSTTILTAGGWHQIVITYTPGATDAVELFIDGASEGTSSGAGADDWSGTDDTGLGKVQGSSAADFVDVDGDTVVETHGFFTGQIAIVRFFAGKALTVGEVLGNFNALSAATDTATVTVRVDGVNDAPDAHDDVLASPIATEGGAAVVSTANLLINDGPIRNDVTGTTDILFANYDASRSATAGTWPNIGSLSASGGDLTVTGATLDVSPGSARVGITTALDFDDTTGGSATMSNNSPQSFPGAIDKADASFEFWVKLHANDLTQISTLFETGGGTGIGVVVDNGVLKGATGIGVGAVSYDLNIDPLALLSTPGDPTAEYFQAVLATDLTNDQNRLYVNGTLVDTGSGNTVSDWDGGDAAGVGRFGGANHGGFQNAAATTAYDTFFKGSMAIFRLYGEAFTEGRARQNFIAVNAGTDVDGDSSTVSGIFDDTLTLQGIGSPATLPSGAQVTLDNATGSFTYDPLGAFDSLPAGVPGTDTFTYRTSDGLGGTADATVTISISGSNDAVNDTIAATEALVTNFTANQIVGNDQHALATSDAFFSVDAASVSGSTWLNIGTGGSAFDVTVSSGTVISPPALESNFGAVGAAYNNVAGSVTSVQSISGDDATFELWFKPTPLQTGKQVLLESGGNGNGMSIVFDADANTVIFTVDGGDDTLNNIIATATGVVTGEFNQLIAVYDQDDAGQSGADSLTLYLNNDPAVAFDATVKGSGINAASLANNWSGADASGIGATSGTAALSQVLSGFLGDISIVRIYARKLSTVEMAANFDSVVQEISNIEGNGVGVSFTTTLNATVTLNADGSFDYDATNLTTPIGDGFTDVDTFDYTISDGLGGFTTATVTVNVAGVDVSFLAIDDNVSIGESDSPMAFAVLANDNFTTATVQLQSLESDYDAAFEVGTLVGDFGNALTGNWSYLWNAPTDWNPAAPGSLDASTGGFGISAGYEPMIWSGTQWTADGDDLTTNNEPTGFLRLNALGGHPGLGSTEAGANGNTQGRGPIAAYTVPVDGLYGIGNSTLGKVSTAGDSVIAEVYVDDTLVGSFAAAPGGTASFDGNLGALTAGQIIYVGVSPGLTAGADTFTLEFDVLILPAADYLVTDIIGSVTTDGTTITYDPSGAFESLGAGQTVLETLTYTINDGAGGTSTATLEITVNGENDAPIGVADTNSTAEDSTVAGNVLLNDTDVDAGDTAGLVVSEVEGLIANVGVEVTLASGAKVTLQSNGSYVYDPNGAFDILEFGDSAQDTFEYLVQDSHGLDDTFVTTVTIDIAGLPVNEQSAVANATQTIIYAIGATNVPVLPAVVASDLNNGIISLEDQIFTYDGATTVFSDGVTPDDDADFDLDALQGFGVTTVDGFAATLAVTVTANDILDGTRRVLYEMGGTSNGHGIYLIDGIPQFIVKMNGATANEPASSNDPNWDANTINIPLTGAKLPTDEVTDIALIFSLDQLNYTVNGGAPVSVPLIGRDPVKDNWAGDHTFKLGTGGGGSGAASSVVASIYEDTFTALEGDVVGVRFWNESDPGTIALDPEILTATISVNPAEGGFTEPFSSTYTPGTGVWVATGTQSQVNVALAALEFLPAVSTAVNATVDVQDGLENGTTAVGGTLTFTEGSAIQDWRLANFGSALDAGASANSADGEPDSLVNLLEFGFGTDPNVSDSAQLAADGSVNGTPLPVLTGGGGVTFELYFNRRDDAGASGSVVYTVEFSADLINFHPSTAPQDFVADSTDDPAYHVAKVPYPLLVTEGKPRFARVKVTEVP